MKTPLKPSYPTRIKTIQESLSSEGCLIEDPLNLAYLTGLTLSRGKLLISKTAALLLVDSRYLESAQKKTVVAVALDEKKQFLQFSNQHSLTTWIFDPQFTSYERYLQLKEYNPQPNGPLFEKLRALKEPQEILQMRRSARLLWQGFLLIKKSLKIGISEKELAKKFELFCLEKGADGLAFEPIIAFGSNSAMPHYRAGNRRLKSGDLVLIDIGVVLNHYHSDMTRTLFFQHKDPILERFYSITLEAYQSALTLCRPGTKIGQLDQAVRAVFKREQVEHLFIHALGHGIGLKTHEFPRIKYDGVDKDTLLKTGMVFTIEPGLYLSGKGGVRYEDTLVITDEGYSNFYPLPGKDK